ncbi:MAG: MarR family winged helix-turn-helix transcriptional regulator [Pseudoclavibacter sp.]
MTQDDGTRPDAPGLDGGQPGAMQAGTTGPERPIELQVMGMFTKVGLLLSRPFHRKFIARYDISLAEWRVMTWVEREPGTTAQVVAQRTGMSPMNVSRALAELREKQLVRAERDGADSRRNNLWLTDHGREIFARIESVASVEIQQTFSVLTPDELVFMRGMLGRLIEHAESLEGDPPEN